MKEFLDYIQGRDSSSLGYTEIRSIQAGDVRQEYFSERASATKYALARSAGGWDAYYGVLPRLSKQGTADSVTANSQVLWADLDAKDNIGGKQSVLDRLIRYDIPASVIVDSGNGYHAYWKLQEAIPTPRACLIMRGLAKQLGGDHVYDAARILRVPGTSNWKDRDHPKAVRVIRFDTTRDMRAADFEHPEAIGWREVAPRPAPKTTYVPPSDREELPDWLQDLIERGAPQGQRSEAIFKVMVNLGKRGYTDDEIIGIIETNAIGEKVTQMRSGGMRWMRQSLAKSRT